MSLLTPIFNFIKPQVTDNIEQTIGVDLPDNFDKIEAEINDNREQINTLTADLKKYAHFRLSANQSIPHSTTTQIVWGTKTPYNGEDFCEIDSATGQIKILKTGMYQVNLTVAFAGNLTGIRNLWTTNLMTYYPNATGTCYTFMGYFIYVTAGTLLNTRVSQTSGGALDIIGSSNTTCEVRKVA